MCVVCALDHTRCNAWVLDGDLYHKGLQGVAVPVDAISNTLLLITVDMSRPWNALDSLQKWAAVAREHIDKLRVAPETLRELEHNRESQRQLSYPNRNKNLNVNTLHSVKSDIQDGFICKIHQLFELLSRSTTCCLLITVLCKHTVVKQFQEYVEPGSSEDGTPQRRSEDEESILLPLGDCTLTHNLGIPVVVVCTKVHARPRAC